MSSYVLRLYVNGKSPLSTRAIANLHRICETDLGGLYTVEVIDVVEHPDRAEEDKILATPTTLRKLPPPIRRVIGDLSDSGKLLLGLDLLPTERPPPTS